jgi:nucleoside-diphosphate-sugar epimerase
MHGNKLDAIIHLAAIVPIKVVNKNKKKAYEVNYIGTKNIVDLIKKENIKWFFFASTSHVYKSTRKKINENAKIEPISFYGKTKYLAEKYIVKKFQKSENCYCIGRIFSTTNKNQNKNYLVPDLKKKIKNTKKTIVLKNLNHYRDFISMEDISKIIFFLYKKNFKGIINIGSGKSIHLKNIAKIICKKYKKKIKFVDNTKDTYLIANTEKLKKIYKLNFVKKIEKLIF